MKILFKHFKLSPVIFPFASAVQLLVMPNIPKIYSADLLSIDVKVLLESSELFKSALNWLRTVSFVIWFKLARLHIIYCIQFCFNTRTKLSWSITSDKVFCCPHALSTYEKRQNDKEGHESFHDYLKYDMLFNQKYNL